MSVCAAGAYEQFWSPLLSSLIALFDLPEDESTPHDEHFVEIEDTPGYQSTFAQLVFVGKTQRDPLADVPDAKQYLVMETSSYLIQFTVEDTVLCTSLLFSWISSQFLPFFLFQTAVRNSGVITNLDARAFQNERNKK